MGKNKNGRRSTKKNRAKDKFNKMGKNTARGIRFKEANMIKSSKKKEDDHILVKFSKETKKSKGKHGASTARAVCAITCKKKS